MRKVVITSVVCLVVGAGAVTAARLSRAPSSSPAAQAKPAASQAKPAASQAKTAAAAAAALPPITISPNAPYVVPPPQAFHPPFDWFAWETFVALNWPAALDSNGVPIRGQANASATIGSPGIRVWETYKADWETFGTGAQSPVPTPWSSWDVNGGMNPCPSSTSAAAAAPPAKRRMIVMATKMDSVFAGINEANSGPLIDQNQKFVRYEIRLNQTMYEQIISPANKWYLQDSLSNPISFTSGVQGTYGAMEIKAAWRELVQGKDDFSRYYNTQATVVDPGSPPVCRDTTLGLIGFHIAVKTTPFTEWVWATFEHVDNVPDGPINPKTRYSLNNGTTNPPTSVNGFNYPPNGASAQTKGPAPLSLNQPLPSNPTPVQVTRFTAIDSNIVSMNNQFQPKLAGTVWANYKLTADQWPTNPSSFKVNGTYPQDSGSPFPNDHVANTSAETYFQNAGAGALGNSCMQCHYGAAFTDFSWTVNDQAYPPLTLSLTSPTAKTMSAAAMKVMTRRQQTANRLRAAIRGRFAAHAAAPAPKPAPTPAPPKKD
jgi:hypothetical protein